MSDSIYPTVPQRVGCDTRSVLRRSTADLNLNVKVKRPILPFYLSISERDRDDFMPFSNKK